MTLRGDDIARHERRRRLKLRVWQDVRGGMLQRTINEPLGPANEAQRTIIAADKPLNLAEYEAYGVSVIPGPSYGYIGSGANDMITLRESRAAFQRLRLRPRILRDVSRVDTTTTLLGHPVDLPIGLAPCAMHCLAHPDGEIASARAVLRHGGAFTLSTVSNKSVEEVAAGVNSLSPAVRDKGLLWWQLYIFKDRNVTREMVARVQAAGYKALVLTVDAPVLGKREADVRTRFGLPSHLFLGNFRRSDAGDITTGKHGSGLAEWSATYLDSRLVWSDVKWLSTICDLPVIVKGVMTAEDASMAIQNGASAVWVSNHGGRQLDTVAAPIELLPEIVRAVAGRAEVYMDGGIMRGTDVIKAIALGARAVFLARPIFWGLAHSGDQGVYDVIRLLREELELGMRLMGATKLRELRPEMVTHATSYWSKL